MIQRKCLQCKTIFDTEQKYINRGHGKFCNTSCAAIYGNASKERPKKTKPPRRANATIERRCAECGGHFETRRAYINRGHGRFCSASCAGKYGNRLRPKLRAKTQCTNCGKTLHRIPSQIKRASKSYCNRECKRIVETTGKFDRKGGKRKIVSRYGHLKKKKELLEAFGIICHYPGCDLDLKNDRKMVDMHHFESPDDHDKTMLLCPYHHRLAGGGHIALNKKGVLAPT